MGACTARPASIGPGCAVALAERAVEADRAREPVTARRGQPRMAPAEAEADREDALARAALGRAQPRDGRGDIGLDGGRLGLRHVLHVGEVVVALAHSAGAAEVVDRDGGRTRARRSAARAPRRSGRDRGRRAGRRCRRTRGRQASRRRPRSCVPSAEERTRSRCETAAPAISGMGGSGVEFEAHARSLRAERRPGRDAKWQSAASAIWLPRGGGRRPTGVASPGWAICRSRRSRTCSAHGGGSRHLQPTPLYRYAALERAGRRRRLGQAREPPAGRRVQGARRGQPRRQLAEDERDARRDHGLDRQPRPVDRLCRAAVRRARDDLRARGRKPGQGGVDARPRRRDRRSTAATSTRRASTASDSPPSTASATSTPATSRC